MGLVTLDCRQESTKHTEAIDTITTYLGLGSYKEWDEEKRTAFLLNELTGKRPLLPPGEGQSLSCPGNLEFPMLYLWHAEPQRASEGTVVECCDLFASARFLLISSLMAASRQQRCHYVLPGLKMSNEVADVVNTFRIIAELPADSMGAYVISMARSASDVLAVVLLQRECGVSVNSSCQDVDRSMFLFVFHPPPTFSLASGWD